MMNTMEYRGFTARIEYDGEDEVFIGRLLGLRAIVSFHADTVAKLKREMHVAVDEYVASCERRGETPEKPLSGNMPLRMPPEVHGRAAILAEASGKSLNQLINDLLAEVLETSRTLTQKDMQVASRSMAGDVISAKKATPHPKAVKSTARRSA
jgi:predicted HicB family RNase H-like nuclease